jgi:DNA-binding response OmpR family regulator
MRLLLVEDSERLRAALAKGLRKEGYTVDIAADGNEGLWFATHHVYDVMILDLMLPGLDGLSLLEKVRQQDGERADVHVLILTAKDTTDDRVKGLKAGADDYLVKPFAFEELLARVQALTRRRYNAKKPALVIGDIVLDTVGRRAMRDGITIDLSAREYALLEFLAMRRGQVLSRSEIEANLYDEQAELMSNVIDVTICSIRRKIDTAGRPSLIQTRRGMGYVLDDPSRVAEPAAQGQT